MEINELIREASGRQLEILLELKKLNKLAYLHMKQFSKNWKTKYREMWRKPFWRRARILLKEYFTIENNGKFVCHDCGKELGKSFVVHHDEGFYKGAFQANIFTPLYIKILDNSCHSKIHKKSKKKLEFKLSRMKRT